MENQLYVHFCKKMQEMGYLSSAMSVLSWDQETYMPEKGAAMRSQQLATLSGIAHDQFTSDETQDLVDSLQTIIPDLTFAQQRNVSEVAKALDRAKKFSREFVMRSSRITSQCFQAWQYAKQHNDFEKYQQPLAEMVALKREACEILGYKNHPYDALFDQYEPETTTADVITLFDDVRQQLVDFVAEIANKPPVDDRFLRQNYPQKQQWDFGIDLLKQMGYDFSAGRQDVSSHPFTTSFGSNDVRVTTRIDENSLDDMIWSCIHEGGHALYEQGLPGAEFGLTSGSAASLGIHESQSRLWENMVGRSLPYWKANYGSLQQIFKTQLAKTSLIDFYKGINKVEPSFIRTSADELTYHFHIMIRFELELALLTGNLKVADLPAAWNDKYKAYLNIEVPNNQKGCLQDVHWSHGSFGYFPTYSIGSFYAAQFYAHAQKAIPNLTANIEAGNLQALLQWLRTNIHQHGGTYPAPSLCQRVTGEKLNFKYFMDYARDKYSFIYDL